MRQQNFPCVVEVIWIETKRGNGTKEDPCRIITQIFEKNGKFVAEYDPVAKPHKDTPKR